MKTNHIFRVLYMMLAAVCLTACSDDAPSLSDIDVDKTALSLLLGNREQITANPIPWEAGSTFEWTSENPSIATVTRFGIVEAVSEGSTNIIVSQGAVRKTIPVTVVDPVQVPPRAASWLFNDPNNLTAAAIGQPLVPGKGKETPAADLAGFSAIAGPSSANGAVRIAGNYFYKATTGISMTASPSEKASEYSLMMDFRIPATGSWYSFFQTNSNNSDDAEYFIRPAGNIGVGHTGYSASTVTPNEWHRLVISMKAGSWLRYYLDGVQIHQMGNIGELDVDRFSLAGTFLICGDDDGDDADMDVAEVAVFGKAMDADQVKKLQRSFQ